MLKERLKIIEAILSSSKTDLVEYIIYEAIFHRNDNNQMVDDIHLLKNLRTIIPNIFLHFVNF